MRIPPAYQTQALNGSLGGGQETRARHANNIKETSLSMRLGKLGITYSTQDALPTPSSTRAETFSRPTTSFAQEFSLALARESKTVSFLPGPTSQASPTSSPLAKARAFQAYDRQADLLQAAHTPDFSAVA
ncbi:hypothetical protein [Desulfoplanes formicivorans]|uniref:Uncharacterized protein n=1 Tax=Desulfoplanes formicivorans TaxID=1592317 RepID=A0A194AIU0_9BACT|nr:hypothetical protein [Desulfoplanes formicivorans]GAU08664.1 hypothetical protein DPF_1380 [Desulfoplanes formicivorans]